jgi:hypothetical protein
MSRGCAITVYFDQNTCSPGNHWEWQGIPPGNYDDAYKKIPICIQGDGGSDWDINGEVRVFVAPMRPTKKSYEIKAWNPAIGYPYIIINGNKHTLSRGEKANGDVYSVERLEDSSDWIEFKITFHR